MKLGIALRDSDAHIRLSTYLNDHFAGSTGATEIIRRSIRANEGNSYAPFLEQLLTEVEEDREALRDVMRRMDVSEDPVKNALAWTAEKAGRLKLNGQLLGYSPLSRLVELEGLSVGVTGKLCLWLGLRAAYQDDPRLTGVDLEELAKRARDQRQRLERVRRKAAVEALT
jgi:hypothetical protein